MSDGDVQQPCEWYEMVRRPWAEKFPRWMRYNALFRAILWHDVGCRKPGSTLVVSDLECANTGLFCDEHGDQAFKINKALREIHA